MKVWHHFIGGERLASTEFTHSYNPATGRPANKVALGGKREVELAAAAAGAALSAWRSVKPIERGRILYRIAEGIRYNAAELAMLESEESGKPAWRSPLEIEASAQYFEFYAGLVNLFHGEVIGLGEGYHAYTLREPYGVVGVITPWNAALNQAARGIAPALAAGNTVVAKPSELTSGTTVRLAEIAHACGLPSGVLNIVLGDGKEAGAALVENPRIRKVAFTGSVRAGREIGHVAAERIIPLTLELGGKSPNIIFDDADLSVAVPDAVRAFSANSGQICSAGTRLLVHAPIHDEVVDRLKEEMAKLTVGPGPDAVLGPLTTKAQYEKVVDFLATAGNEGASEPSSGADGGDWGEGWFVRPRLYVGVQNAMRLAREEIFGPVLSVIAFDTEEDAIRIANDTEFGLAAGIYTRCLARAHRVAAAVEAGQIYVNEYQAGGVETPFGGFKNSGYGREKGIEALHHYTQLKCVTMKL